MNQNLQPYEEARSRILRFISPVGKKTIKTEECFGAVLAQDFAATDNIPPFDRSPYDGYAFRAEDTAGASEENPVTLCILEEIPAGSISHIPVTEGTAVKILTGAPIPEGADAVRMFEKTSFTEDTVTLFSPAKRGENVIYAGEDVKKGTVLACEGTRIDAGLCGSIAAQNITSLSVFKKPVIGLISTGSELLELGSAAEPGKIIDSNRYTLTAELIRLGCEVRYLGTVRDSTEAICALLQTGTDCCDMVITTGGVSVGDYDMTEKAMEMAGAEILVHGIAIKPGMACAYGILNGILIAALSGNPASSLINFHAVAAPVIRKLCGLKEEEWVSKTFAVSIADRFKKASPLTRFLRGKLGFEDGRAVMHFMADQGNVVLSSSIGADIMTMVPAGSGPLEPGMKLQAFLI